MHTKCGNLCLKLAQHSLTWDLLPDFFPGQTSLGLSLVVDLNSVKNTARNELGHTLPGIKESFREG